MPTTPQPEPLYSGNNLNTWISAMLLSAKTTVAANPAPVFTKGGR